MERVVADMVAARGVPVSIDAAHALADEIYPLVLEQRRKLWAMEAAALVDEFPGVTVPAVDVYPLTATRKLVRRVAGLTPEKRQNVQLELFDPATIEMVKTSVPAWTMPDDEAVIAAMKSRLSAGVSRHAKAASRDAVINTAAANRMRWARQLSGVENCAFCAMLASRGAVYTEKTVTFQSHDHCDCTGTLVPDAGTWDGQIEADALYSLWVKSDGLEDFGKRFREAGL